MQASFTPSLAAATHHRLTTSSAPLGAHGNARVSARPWNGFGKSLLAVISGTCLATGLSGAAEQPHVGSEPTSLKSLQNDVQAIVSKCAGATVSIIASSNGKSAAGSGVVVSEDGIILTAAHVLDGLGDMATVFFPDGRSVPAKLLGSDFDRDAAMLQILKEGSYPHVDMSDRREPAVNDWCVAMGHPGGFDPERPPVLRLGHVMVSGDFLLTDCTVVGGDSGGPLFDTAGKLIGIHSSIGFGLNENRHVPVSLFRDSWDKLKAGERYGSRFSSELKNQGADAPAVFGKVDADGKDDLDRFLDESLKSGNGQGELRLTPEVLKRFGGMETIMRRMGARAGNKAASDGKSPQAKPDGSAPAAPKEGQGPVSGMELLDLVNKARASGAQLEVTPELLEKMGGMQGLMTQLKALGITGDGTQPSGTRLPEELRIRDPFIESLHGLMASITGPTSQSVAMVLVGGQPQSLATVVGADGYLVAPDLDAKAGDLTVRIGERDFVAKVVKRDPQYGLMLLKVDAKGLTAVDLAATTGMAEVGTLVTASSPNGQALGFGVVGVKERNTIDTPFLGIAKAGAQDGVKVKAVAPRGPADVAGVRAGDVIRSISGHPVRKDTLWDVLKKFAGGDTVDLDIQRGEETLSLSAKLAPSLFRMQSERLRVMNSMSGPLSARDTGFVRALQHDLALSPQQCGGPLLDLDGRCIGINVSRAGRVETLAIPAAAVTGLIKHDDTAVAAPSASDAPSVVAEDAGWTHDFEAAKKQAAEQHKSLLIDFTGSDWCGWCKRLHKEVFEHDAFTRGVKDKFVLVELDFPRDKSKLPAETQVCNEKLRDGYGIQSFPTILLTDEKGVPFAKTGYREGGPEAYVANLDELLKLRAARDEAFAKAAATQGVEKAKVLVAALDAMHLTDSWITNFYGDVVAQIKAADPQDETGFTKRAVTKERFQSVMTDVGNLIQKRDNGAALTLIDEALQSDDFEGDMKQQISFHRGIALAQMMKFEEAYAAFDASKEINPKSPLASRIDRMKVNLQQMQARLEEAKKAKEGAKGEAE